MTDFRKLEAQLHAQRRPLAIVRKYARKRDDGRLMKCVPGRLERAQGDTPRSVGKYIYDTPELAKACAREFHAAGLGRMYVYPRHRSKHGHVHLTSKKPAGNSARRTRRSG